MTERRPTSASNSESTETPPPPSDKNPEKEEPKEPTRESKRLKSCTALEKLGELSASNGIFSFTFDTKLVDCCSPEFTPKFGSFNPVTSKPPEKDRRPRKSGDEEEGTDRQAEDRGDEEEEKGVR
ncbi:hypothetical protein SLA2020_493650 [Shorea laevis]